MDPVNERYIKSTLTQEGFTVGNELGKGAFGVVYKATKDGYEYAIKVIKASERNTAVYKREIDMHYALNQSQCLQYAPVMSDTFAMQLDPQSHDNDWHVIVEEFIPGMDLVDYLNSKPANFSNDAKYNMSLLLAKAVQCIHSIPMAHRDLKIENMRVALNNNDPILIDFGLGCLIDSNKKISACAGLVGSPKYLPIELFIYFVMNQERNKPPSQKSTIPRGINVPRMENKISETGSSYQKFQGYDWRKSDVWTLGYIIYIIYHNRMPFFPVNDKDVNYQSILNQMATKNYSKTGNACVDNAIDACLNPHYETRVDINEIVRLLECKVPQQVSSRRFTMQRFP